MQTNDYASGFERLKSQYGNSALTNIEIDYIFDFLKRNKVGSNQWTEICNKIICSKKSIPTVYQFFDFIKDDIQKNKNIYEPVFKEQKSGTVCNWCKDTGHVWVSRQGVTGKVFAFCNCSKGHLKKDMPINKYRDMVMWSDDMKDFFRIPIDYEFFVPPTGELRVEYFINKKVLEYKKTLTGSDQYWARTKGQK